MKTEVMRSFMIALTVLVAGLASANAQEALPDYQADVRVQRPAFAENSGPLVVVDSGHHNYHTINGRFGPFAALLRNDGFRVTDFSKPLTAKNLSEIRVLVISNALPVATVENWNLPLPSAFSASEIDSVKTWVATGGSLLLIADHLPFAGSASDLALAFGFSFENGVASRDPPDAKQDIFTILDGTLRDDAVTRGRDPNEGGSTLRTFTGSAFRAPGAARPIIVFPPGYAVHECGLPCPAGVPEHDVSGYLQGAVLTVGKGHVAVFGEAAMFSAQVVATTPPYRFGFNARGAEQNKQFVLNLLHWLSGVILP